MNDNLINAGIETDRALSDILSNFSTEIIDDTIMGAMRYRFRPFGTRMANYPAVLKDKFNVIMLSYTGPEPDRIKMTIAETFYRIIEVISINHKLAMGDIPEEHLYPLAYYLFQIFVSEYTERTLNFFVRYIELHGQELVNTLPPELATPRSSYAKKMYKDQVGAIIYDNMEEILDMVAGLDINFDQLMQMLADDPKAAEFISSYISEISNTYRLFFASLITDSTTRTDTITYVKIKYMETQIQKANMNDTTIPVI